MILEIDGWKFDIDLTATMEYSASEAADHCDCAYCRNFYAAVDNTYPHLRSFLAQFGLDIEAPEELMPYDIEKKMWYDGIYAVCGKILSAGSSELVCDGVIIHPKQEHELHINVGCPEPYFLLDVGTFILPWVLDEPMEDVISPANEPSFLKKMWNKLLKRQPKNDVTS